jgi:long-chain fatty acid transport protein
VAVAGLTLLGTTAGHAAGFALIEQSVPDMGTAYAGSAASDDSVGTLYFNPAGMTRLSGTLVGAAVHLIEPNTEFKNGDTTFSSDIPPFLGGGSPISGGEGGDAGGLAGVPHFYLTHQFDDKTWFGLAVNAPFGLTTEYKSDWVGRYHAIKSEVKTLNINPSVGYKLNDQVSLALGVSAMYLDGEFTNAVDFGLLNLPLPGNPLAGWAGPGVGPGGADGKSKIEGDSWGWGVNVGALFAVAEDTRIGMHYRSEVEQNIEGDVEFTLPDPGLAAAFPHSDVKADVDLPATFSISGFHQINRQWAVVGDYTWTGWSSIPELRFRFDSAVPDGVTTFDWKDTSRVALGTIYTPDSSDWVYRFGAAYDESPIKDAETRSARLPDVDRIWVTVGAGYRPSDDLRIDFGYAHLFMNDAKISKTAKAGTEDFSRGSLNGSYEASVDILSVQAEYIF